jgi:hypothetical protein
MTTDSGIVETGALQPQSQPLYQMHYTGILQLILGKRFANPGTIITLVTTREHNGFAQ